MTVDNISKFVSCHITEHRCDEKVTNAIFAFVRTLFPGGMPRDPVQFINSISDKWLSKSLEGKEVIHIKEIITTDGAYFILAPEQQNTLKTLIESAYRPETIINNYGLLKDLGNMVLAAMSSITSLQFISNYARCSTISNNRTSISRLVNRRIFCL